MTAAAEVRVRYRDVIVGAEARADADVQRGIVELQVKLDDAEWPWDRDVIRGHLRRLGRL